MRGVGGRHDQAVGGFRLRRGFELAGSCSGIQIEISQGGGACASRRDQGEFATRVVDANRGLHRDIARGSDQQKVIGRPRIVLQNESLSSPDIRRACVRPPLTPGDGSGIVKNRIGSASTVVEEKDHRGIV